MANMHHGLLNETERTNWVRLRTLVMLRWIAVGGQLSAIVVAQHMFRLELDIGLSLMAIGISVIANLVAGFIYPENKRLSEREIAMMLIFDMVQLTALLYLTGGLHNPFALLILAPVTIAATALRPAPTILIGAVAIGLITFVMWFYRPLRTETGFVMQMPQDFVFGFWVAIVIGVFFLGAYAHRITSEINSMSEALLATQMALAREQKISDLAGVVAATAHELGTPLATIKLTSSELVKELSDRPELQEDAALIRDQADRCRDILHSMGQAGKDDLHMRTAPLITVVREAAEPHLNRGKDVIFTSVPGDDAPERQPIIWRRPEIVHGLRNLIQNAVDFAASTVWVDLHWTKSQVTVRIIDDGRGYPLQVIGRIGEPFVRLRSHEDDQKKRPGYQGMGLGLFIAKTLLERSGAEINFSNGRDPYSDPPEPGLRGGAIVEIIWPVRAISPGEFEAARPLGDNPPIPT